MKRLFFNDSIVEVHLNSGFVQTIYDDDTFVPALPQNDPLYLHTTNELGYDNNVVLMTIHHEIMHTFLSESVGLPHSPTLWSLAHNNIGLDCIPVWKQYEEEALVLSFQKYIKTLRVDPIITDFESKTKLRVKDLRKQAVKLLDFS